MANTPQAKKRIRRNATRQTINHSRVSRIRTFIKAVESAIESGKKAEAAEALKAGSAGDCARRRPRRYPQEHGRAEIFPAVQAGCRRSAKNRSKRDIHVEPSGNRRLVPFLDCQKNAAIPAIRAAVNGS